jgi:preprotein translocase subunit SecB
MSKLVKTSFITKELSIKNNFFSQGKFIPKLTRRTGKLSENSYYTDLVLKIEDTKENPFPVNVLIDFRGVFDFKNIEDKEEIESFLKIQAVHIMYPYLRSILTSLTNAAMMPPLVLPIIDASQIFKDSDTLVKIL